jgi:hypothetical protein
MKPDPELERLLYLAAGTELVQAGLSSASNAANPDYVLSAQYTMAGNAVTVHYILYRRIYAGSPGPPGWFASHDTVLAELTFEADLDYTLDARVAEAVRGLLGSAGIAYVMAPDARIEGILSSPPPVQTPAEEAGGTAPNVHMKPSAHIEPAFKVSFDSSFSTAGIFFIGGISQFTSLGLGARLEAGVSFLWKIWRLGIDGDLQFIRAFNNQGVVGGPLYFVLLGPDVQFGIGRTGLLRIMGDLSGGAALISVLGAEGAMAKTRPYADAGLYAGILLGDSFSIGGDARFTMIFDQEVLVMGVSAALSLRMEL